MKEGVIPRQILYATDFSGPSRAALPYALSLARRYQANVVVLNVVPVPPVAGSSAMQTVTAQAMREAQEAIAHLEPMCKKTAHRMLIRKGDVWTEIAQVIEEEKADLVVSGTHGRTGVSKVLMGSVAEKVFRQAPCPVLTVGPNITGEPDSVADIHSILFPTDFTPESLAAASYAISLAREHQARLFLLHVVESDATGDEEASLQDRLRSLVGSETGLWCEPKAQVATGNAANEINRLAEELAVDLIVLGPKRRPILPGATHLPASTAYRVVSQASCPVLTVRAAAHKARQAA